MLIYYDYSEFRCVCPAMKELQASMHLVFPVLKEVKVDYFWSGNVGFTFDQMPHLGKLEGIYYSMGYCGHGIAPSLYFGKILASLISGEEVDLPFAQLGFQSRFFYRRRPWFLPLAGAFYKLVDRFSK